MSNSRDGLERTLERTFTALREAERDFAAADLEASRLRGIISEAYSILQPHGGCSAVQPALDVLRAGVPDEDEGE